MQSAGGVADELVQHHASVAGQVEHGAVDEANSDPPVGCGLDHVTLANRIANDDANGNAIRAREGAAANRCLNIADDLAMEGNNCLTIAPKRDAGRNKHWLGPHRPSNSELAWCHNLFTLAVSAPKGQTIFALPGRPDPNDHYSLGRRVQRDLEVPAFILRLRRAVSYCEKSQKALKCLKRNYSYCQTCHPRERGWGSQLAF